MGGYAAVSASILTSLTDSQDFWPADFGNYGPFFIRLAWHCAGSYRQSDGRGGCDGARILHDPELNWPDNANLKHAIELLKPIKEQYGSSLSWGDLIILAGNVAIQSMGGPLLGFCGGRMDDPDGFHSLRLGPTDEQEAIMPCEVSGFCTSPLGPTQVGLIYVNAEGTNGVPEPSGSVSDIRASFKNMGMNDTETVALVGGGHAFGKAHGACLEPPCGSGDKAGKGENTYTMGFEGAWTTAPTTWTNQYFNNLLNYNWTKHKGPGGKWQWEPFNADGTSGAAIMMLTTDIALMNDTSYLAIVQEWAANITPLETAFSHAWYKLTSRDMGPRTRCLGDDIPPAQPFQRPLPDAPSTLPDFVAVRARVQALLHDTTVSNTIDPDTVGSGTQHTYYGAMFATLSWRCASTYRATDHMGGCNGARIRFLPENNWTSNAGMPAVIEVLQRVPVRK